MDAHEIQNAAELAIAYFDDGAPRSAARILKQTSDKLKRYANTRDAEIKKFMEEMS